MLQKKYPKQRYFDREIEKYFRMVKDLNMLNFAAQDAAFRLITSLISCAVQFDNYVLFTNFQMTFVATLFNMGMHIGRKT